MFTDVVEQHSTFLITFAISIIGDAGESEEIVQDVFLRIWEQRATWTPHSSIRAYLATAVRRRAIDILRHRRVVEKAMVGVVANHPEPSAPPVPDDALWQAVDQLDLRWREAIVLRYVQKLSYDEMSQVLEVSPDAARMTVNRAVQALRKVLDHE